MSRTLRKTLYLGLAALMVGSVGATAASVNPQKVSARRYYRYYGYYGYHRYYHRHARVTSFWHRADTNYDRTLNGWHAIYNKPSMLGGHVIHSTSQIRQAVRNGQKFEAYYGEEVNHDDRYYKVVSQNHKIRGWIYAGSVKLITKPEVRYVHPKTLSNSDRQAYRRVQRDFDRGTLLVGLADSEYGANNHVAQHDMGYAESELSSAKYQTGLISDSKAKASASKLDSELASLINKSGRDQVSDQTKHDNHLNNDITNDVKGANVYLHAVAADLHGSHAKDYLKMARTLLNQASSENNEVSNQESAKSSAIAIKDANNYANELENEINSSSNNTPTPYSEYAFNQINKSAKRAYSVMNNIKAETSNPANMLTPSSIANMRRQISKDAGSVHAHLDFIKGMQPLVKNSYEKSQVNEIINNLSKVSKI